MSQRDFAAGVIVFHRSADGQITYLIIKNSEPYWEFPKGHPNPGETWHQTARRELEEETGIYDIDLMPGFSRQIRYIYRDGKKKVIDKQVCFALGKTHSTQIVLSDEHSRFLFLDYEKALQQLTHAGTRALLREADVFLRQHQFQKPSEVEIDMAKLNNAPEREID